MLAKAHIPLRLLLAAVIVFSTGHAANDSRLSLEDAKKYAVQHNYEVLALRREWEASQAKAGGARAAFYPKLGVATGADTLTSTTSNNTGAVAYAYGTFNVFNGFEDSIRLRVADFAAEKAEIRFKRAEFRVGLDVELEFHTLLFKKCSLELNQEALKLNQTQQKMAVTRRASGMAAESDVLEFDLRDSILRSEIYSLEQQIEESRARLRKLLGEEVGASVQPVGHLQHQHLSGNLMDFINRMKSENETVLLAAKDLAITQTEAGLWRSRWLPKLDLESRAGYLSVDYRPASGSASFLAMAYLRMDLFSGFQSIWERREGEMNRLRAEAQLKNALLSAVTDMETAFRRMKTIQHRVDLEDKNEDRARKYYRIVSGEYRRGVKNAADLRVAAEAVFNTSLRKKQYQYDFLTQKNSLERALGAPVKTEIIPEKD